MGPRITFSNEDVPKENTNFILNFLNFLRKPQNQKVCLPQFALEIEKTKTLLFYFDLQMIFIELQSQKYFGPRVQVACRGTSDRIFEACL